MTFATHVPFQAYPLAILVTLARVALNIPTALLLDWLCSRLMSGAAPFPLWMWVLHLAGFEGIWRHSGRDRVERFLLIPSILVVLSLGSLLDRWLFTTSHPAWGDTGGLIWAVICTVVLVVDIPRVAREITGWFQAETPPESPVPPAERTAIHTTGVNVDRPRPTLI